jgi:cytochrome c2
MSIRSGRISDKAVQGCSFLFLLPLMASVLLAACTITSDTEKGLTGERSVRTDAGSIAKGKSLFESQCVLCHATNSTETVVGPGLKGIMKKPFLPVSKKPATPENIAGQMKQPYRDMPSFPHLSDDEIDDIIAYLNTL